MKHGFSFKLFGVTVENSVVYQCSMQDFCPTWPRSHTIHIRRGQLLARNLEVLEIWPDRKHTRQHADSTRNGESKALPKQLGK